MDGLLNKNISSELITFKDANRQKELEILPAWYAADRLASCRLRYLRNLISAADIKQTLKV